MVNNAAAGRALGRGAPTERSERADGRLRRRAVFDEQAPIGGRGGGGSGSDTDDEDGAYADGPSSGTAHQDDGTASDDSEGAPCFCLQMLISWSRCRI